MTVRQHYWTLAFLATLASANKWNTAMEQADRVLELLDVRFPGWDKTMPGEKEKR